MRRLSKLLDLAWGLAASVAVASLAACRPNTGHAGPAPEAERSSASDAFLVGWSLATGQATLGSPEEDTEGAVGAFRVAMLAGDPEWSPRASYALGAFLWERRDAGAAELALAMALSSGHRDWAPAAWIVQGVIAASRGDVGAAEAAYRSAIDSGHATHGPAGWFNLGTLFQQHGDFEGAVAAYRAAQASSDVELRAKAAVNLGFVLFNHLDDPAGAETAFRAAIAVGHPEQSRIAAGNLGALRAHQIARARGDEVRVVEEPGDVSIGGGSGSVERRTWVTTPE